MTIHNYTTESLIYSLALAKENLDKGKDVEYHRNLTLTERIL